MLRQLIVSELLISHRYKRRVSAGSGRGKKKKKKRKTEEEIKNFNRARGEYYTNQLHSAEIIDELSTLLVIN